MKPYDRISHDIMNILLHDIKPTYLLQLTYDIILKIYIGWDGIGF